MKEHKINRLDFFFERFSGLEGNGVASFDLDFFHRSADCVPNGFCDRPS